MWQPLGERLVAKRSIGTIRLGHRANDLTTVRRRKLPPEQAIGPVIDGAIGSARTGWRLSEQVNRQRVRFKNQYGMRVAGNLFTPKSLDRQVKNAAMIVGHPMGAVKEQSADLYATKMAERGLTLPVHTRPGWYFS